MKKLTQPIAIIAILLMAMLLFTACGNVVEQLTADEELTTNEQLTSDEELTSEEQLTIEDFLSDFDYLIQSMEDTFPFFGVAERRLGVDIRALRREIRDMIKNYPYSLEGRANEMGISLEDMPDLDQHILALCQLVLVKRNNEKSNKDTFIIGLEGDFPSRLLTWIDSV